MHLKSIYFTYINNFKIFCGADQLFCNCTTGVLQKSELYLKAINYLFGPYLH